MVTEWRDYEGYMLAMDQPKIAGPVSGDPESSPAPSDVQRVRELAAEFHYGDDGWVLDDSFDGTEWVVAAVGTGFVVALGAFCIIGAVHVARWLGWA